MKIQFNKKIEIEEFRAQGYLQELNRRFLHPLGLALEVIVDENGTESLGGIWDFREDIEGIYFDLQNSDDTRKEESIKKYDFIEKEINKRFPKRAKKLGFDIEPIKGDKNE